MSLRRLNLYFLFFFSLGLFILFLQIFQNPLNGYLRQTAYIIFSPFLKTEREIEEEMEKLILFIKDLKANMRLISNYKKVSQQLEIYKEKAELYQDILRRLEKDLDFYFPLKAEYVISKIIFYDPSGEDRFFIIRDGKNKGIKKGDLVVSKGYILGVVDEVYISTSKVITLFNEKCSLLSSIKGNDKAYIYQGSYPIGNLLYVDLYDNVKEGDIVVYKDLTLRIPPFPIGQVIFVGFSQNPFFKRVKVKPFISPRDAEFVVVFKE